MSETPKRIWAFHDGPLVGYFVGQSPGEGAYVAEYIRDDLVTATLGAARDKAKARIAALEAKLAKAVDETLDAASAYMKKQYGIEALSHPVDRARIIAELKGDKT